MINAESPGKADFFGETFFYRELRAFTATSASIRVSACMTATRRMTGSSLVRKLQCFHCFPYDVPAEAKRCKVFEGGKWIDGFLLEWQRGEDHRWKGLVNYRHEAGRRVSLKDQAELRPDEN